MKSSTSVIMKQADHILQILVVIFYYMYNDGVSKEERKDQKENVKLPSRNYKSNSNLTTTLTSRI
jgi:hypothetical protein